MMRKAAIGKLTFLGGKEPGTIPDAKWIWLAAGKETVNQYVEFIRGFRMGRVPRGCQACVAADSDYELWINGNLAGWNQYPDWPGDRPFNTHAVGRWLRSGWNCVAVRVHYRGEGFLTYAKGIPGLWFMLRAKTRVLLTTDGSWRCRRSPSYRGGPVPKVTMQLGFTVEYDARKDDGWTRPGYDERTWRNALEQAGLSAPLRRRPVPPLVLAEPRPARLHACGHLRVSRRRGTVAQRMMRDLLSSGPLKMFMGTSRHPVLSRHVALPVRSGLPLIVYPPPAGGGLYLVFDLGQEEAGLLDLDVDAAPGTILDIAHGEHLDDLRVRASVGDRNFADRYICRRGRQRWMLPFRRLGCRYLEIHIPRLTAPLRVYHISLRPTPYPFKRPGTFQCSDGLLNDIWTVGRRTVELCAHEHYEDCPWREQALWVGTDSRMDALFGFYLHGETRLPAACWDLVGRGLRKDGLVAITAPSRFPHNIPVSSLIWIRALWDLLLFSGAPRLIARQWEPVCAILDAALSRMGADGVVGNLAGSRYWHFYEWNPGMGPDQAAGAPQGRRDAIYNLFLIGALDAAARLSIVCGDARGRRYAAAVARIRAAWHDVFWDASRRSYASYRRGRRLFHYAQLTQALALGEGVVPRAAMADELRSGLLRNRSWIEATVPSKFYVYQALLQAGEQYAAAVLNDVRATFGRMLLRGATSLWEVEEGADAFWQAGSLCHSWAASFVYLAGAHLLGVRPLTPGFKRFSVAPITGGLAWAEGDIPTPAGLIRVAWRDTGGDFLLKLRHPRGLKPEIGAPRRRRLLLDLKSFA